MRSNRTFEHNIPVTSHPSPTIFKFSHLLTAIFYEVDCSIFIINPFMSKRYN